MIGASETTGRRPVVLMFSGQGSQYYQMGRGLWESHGVFRHWMQRADARVRQRGGPSLVEEIYSATKAKGDVFDRITITHPAIFSVEYALYQTVAHAGLVVDVVLGSSLGEISAAAVTGVFGFEAALDLICDQAAMLEERCPNSGSMIAILGPVTFFETDPVLCGATTLAGINFANHFLVSVVTEQIGFIERHLRERGVTFQRLPLTHGFHSAAIEPIAEPYGRLLNRQSYKVPNRPLVLCSSGKKEQIVNAEMLWTTARGPIRFHETIQRLEGQGPWFYVDAGPSGTLATLAQYNLSPGAASRTAPLLNPYGRDVENLEKVLKKTRESLVEERR